MLIIFIEKIIFKLKYQYNYLSTIYSQVKCIDIHFNIFMK